MKSILQIGKYYHPDRGGIEYYTKMFAEYLAEKGYTSSVVVFGSKSTVESINGVDVKRFRASKFGPQPISLRYITHSAKVFKKYDKVIIHLPNYWVILLIILIKRDYSVVWHADFVTKNKFIRKTCEYLDKFILRLASEICVTTQAYADHSRSLQEFHHKITELPIPCPSIEHWVPSDTPKNKELKLVTVGRLVEYKSFDFLLYALSEYDREFSLNIIGDGPKREMLESLIQELDLSDKVILRGDLSDIDKFATLQGSDVFVMTSSTRAEAFGVVLLEAMSVGTRLLVSRIPGSGVSKVASCSKYNELYDLNDQRDFLIKLRKIQDDNRDTAMMKSQIVDSVKKTYSMEKIGKDFISYLL